jgi:hypothetical protein
VPNFLFSAITPVSRFNSTYLQELGDSIQEFLNLLPSPYSNLTNVCHWLICLDNEEVDIDLVYSVLNQFSPKIVVTVIPKPSSTISTPGSARNRGLALTDSQWLLTLDGDDFIEPHGFLKLFKIVSSNPDIFWAAGKAFDVDPSGKFLREGPESHLNPGLNFKGFFYAHRVSKNYPPFSP